MNVIDVPGRLDARSFDRLAEDLVELPEGKILFDARHVRWVDPAGITGLLAAGAVARDRLEEPARIQLPESTDVAGYLGRMGFHGHAREVFALEEGGSRRATDGASDVLLEVTSISENQDVHRVVDRVQARAGAILSRTLGYPPPAVVQFCVVLSEVCQNVVEHAEAPGWVAAQTYRWARRLGRDVLVISVADVGRGFRGSLAEEHAARFGDRWGDGTALEAAFIHGLTRFPDSGRGQGIQQIRKQVGRWNGLIQIRSGTARIADVPEWDDAPPMEEELPPFPGAQILIVLPARAEIDG